MFQRRRSPRAAAVLAAAAAGLALARPATAFATSGHQAPRHNSHRQNNGYHGPQREDVSLYQVDLASDVPGMDQ